MGRLVESNAGQRGGKEWETETFAYDGNGRLLLAENKDCRLQWFYDLAGNNTREHQPKAQSSKTVSWNQDTPVTAADAKRMLTELKVKLSGRDLNMRSEAFTKAVRHIDDACKCGGVSA